MNVQDFQWKKGITASKLTKALGGIGFQAVSLLNAAKIILKMKKAGAKVYLTFTSNMVSSGLRGFFAQLIDLGIADVLVTTAGGIEEDIMKAKGEEFSIGEFFPDDVELYEKGINRIGNIFIRNESYQLFEDTIGYMLKAMVKEKSRWPVSEMLSRFGKQIDDEHSILFQAARHDVPIFCPGITDGALGFHLYLLQQRHPDFVVDIVRDFSNILFSTSHDEKKGLISLGGGISKHYAILATLLNGGLDYVVYMTTSRSGSGSMSGATTNEAKSWGKIKDNSDAVTVEGDVTITFPLVMSHVLDSLSDEGLL